MTLLMCSNLTENQASSLPTSNEPQPQPQSSRTAISRLPQAAFATRNGKVNVKVET